MDDVIAWVQLLATLGLLGATYWYARTTKDMAGSAREAATESARATSAAERSAEAARDAATVAQSQIKPEFKGRQVSLAPRDETGDHTNCLRIDSIGDAVVIQRVRIRRAFRKSWDSGKREVAVSDVDMEVAGLDSQMPRRLHFGEHLLVTHPSIQDVRDDPFARFIVDIEYTFSEAGGAGAIRELIIDEK